MTNKTFCVSHLIILSSFRPWVRQLSSPVDLRGRKQLGQVRRRNWKGRLWTPRTVPGLCGRLDWQGSCLTAPAANAPCHQAHEGIVRHKGIRYSTGIGRGHDRRRIQRHFIALHWLGHRTCHVALCALLHGWLVLLLLPRRTHQEHAAMAQGEVGVNHKFDDDTALWLELLNELELECTCTATAN